MTDRVNICVYCGSSPGDDPAFLAAAEALGTAIAAQGCRLIYGAGDLGLMGQVARAALAAGGEAIGVIPHHLDSREIALKGLTALVRTETMHERKKAMFATADAFIVLPGGPGTLDEMIETLTWRQLGLHEKPLAIVNTNGYWQPFETLLSHMATRGFMHQRFLGFYDVEDAPEAAVSRVLSRLSARNNSQQ